MLIPLAALLSLSACVSASHDQVAKRHSSHVLRALTGDALLKALFPISVETSGSRGWTTIEGVPDSVPLNDETLNTFKDTKALPHPFVNGPEGKSSIKATFSKGSWTPRYTPHGGFSFYASGPSSVDWTTAREVTFGYSGFFDKDFDFNIGGTLPGLCASSYTSCQYNR